MLEMRRVDPDVLALHVVVLEARVMEKLEFRGGRDGDGERVGGKFMSDAPSGCSPRRMDENVHWHRPHGDHFVVNLDLCIKSQQPQYWQCLVCMGLPVGTPLAHKRPVGFTLLQKRTHGRNSTTDLTIRQRARAHVKRAPHQCNEMEANVATPLRPLFHNDFA